MSKGKSRWDADARALWARCIDVLSEGKPRTGWARSPAAPRRRRRGLALLYAVLDRSEQIKLVHLKAALALWQYCEEQRKAPHISGDSVGDPLTDELLRALRNEWEMTRTQIRDLFKRNKDAGKIDAALASLRSTRPGPQ